MHRDDSDLRPHVGGERSTSDLEKFWIEIILMVLWLHKSYKAKYVAAPLNRQVLEPYGLRCVDMGVATYLW